MPQEHTAAHPSWTRYLASWLGLLALTLLSFGISYAHTGAWEIPIALLIAVAKSLIVLLFFMHLIEQKFINAFVLIVALSLLGMLVVITGAEVATRRTFPPAPLHEITPPPPRLSPAPPGGGAGPPPEPPPPSGR